jgi:hypothetical protein
VQHRAARLYPAIVAAAEDSAPGNEHRADRDAALGEPLAGFVEGGLQEVIAAVAGDSVRAGGGARINPQRNGSETK